MSQEQQKVSSAAAWEEKAQQRGELLDIYRAEEEKRLAKQADLERRSALLAEKLRKEDRHIQEQLFLQSVGLFGLFNCSHGAQKSTQVD